MFIEFEVGNFRSFRDRERFSMQAAPLRSNDAGLEEDNVFTKNDIRLLKSKAIFGSNSSGKSNLARAMSFFAIMVAQSVKWEGFSKQIWDERFGLITNWEDQPVFFQYRFFFGEQQFRYGFQILDGKIEYEWLFGTEGRKETEFFMRGPGGLSLNKENFAGAEAYVEPFMDEDNEIFRPDALFLTGAALNGHKFAAGIRNTIRDIIFVDGMDDARAVQYAMHFLEKGTKEEIAAFKQFIHAADTGIDDLNILDLPDSIAKQNQEKNPGNKETPQTVFSAHKRYDDEGKFMDRIFVPFVQWESQGSAKLFAIVPLILRALRKGQTLVIDEYDARFHANLSLKIVKLFQSSKTNPHNAQLIFITHDTGLLRRAGLRRDQISLINKDKYGISTISTLIQYKGVRKDASYEKEYLQGSYSGVPYLDEIDWVIANIMKEEGHGLPETE